MKREDLKKLLELFRDGHLTEERTIETIMECMASPSGKQRGEVDMRDPVRALVVQQLDAKGLTMKEASLRMGRSHSYLQQFLMRWIPRDLPEKDRPKLAQLLDVAEDQLRGSLA
jgi:lambda repressor-like predicted transcriptional regulator